MCGWRVTVERDQDGHIRFGSWCGPVETDHPFIVPDEPPAAALRAAVVPWTVRTFVLALALSWTAVAALPQHAIAAQQHGIAAQRTAFSTVDSAPRRPLASEPPATAWPLAPAALYISLGFLVGAVLALLFFVRLRQRPARRLKRSFDGSVGWR